LCTQQASVAVPVVRGSLSSVLQSILGHFAALIVVLRMARQFTPLFCCQKPLDCPKRTSSRRNNRQTLHDKARNPRAAALRQRGTNVNVARARKGELKKIVEKSGRSFGNSPSP
jgi:hypothetical protein